MPIRIFMPALSPTMTEGNLARWLKAEGDNVAPGDVIAEIETDKATMEVEAIDGGTLHKIFIPEGTDNVAVNTLIAVLLEEGEDISALEGIESVLPLSTLADLQPDQKELDQKIEAVAVEHKHTSSESRILASPLARRIATQKEIDLSQVIGSGPKGRIIKVDVESAVSRPQASLLSSLDVGGLPSFDDIKLSTMRKVIAKRLTEAKQTVPHFYLTIDCQIDDLLSYRKEMNASLDVHQRVSVNDFILKATGKALQDVPDANASFADTHMRRYHRADLSVAVAIEGGLVTPVLKGANILSLLELSYQMKALLSKARAGKLIPEEYQGGTFSISNLGMYGIKQFAAVINPPQGCILAIGAGEERPIVKDGAIVMGTMMSCTLSVDHRVVDGAVGAEFLQAFKKYIEKPLLMLI